MNKTWTYIVFNYWYLLILFVLMLWKLDDYLEKRKNRPVDFTYNRRFKND